MGLVSKFIWTAGLLVVLISVLVISQANVINCQKIQRSIHGIHDDRLVVKGYIIELISAVHKKELATVLNDQDFFRTSNLDLNKEVNSLLKKFRATNLTVDERRTLDRVELTMEALAETEAKLNLPEGSISESADAILSDIKSIKVDLDALTKIQRDEGKRKLSISVVASKNMDLTSRIGKYLASLIVVVMIGFILSRPKRKAS